jgi:hypothetical protein
MNKKEKAKFLLIMPILFFVLAICLQAEEQDSMWITLITMVYSVTPIKSWIPSQAEFEEMKKTLLPAHASLTKSIPDFLESLNKSTQRIFRSVHDVDRKRS